MIGLVTLTEKEYNLIKELVYNLFGINLGEKKKSLVEGRLNKILKESGLKSFNEYYDYVISDPTREALSTLIDRISTNHTYFYRENDHFNYFRNTVMDELTGKLRRNEDFRIWSAGCSSGEEPYMLAMLTDEFFKEEKISVKYGILATDISVVKLNKAIEGVYDTENVSKLPGKYKLSYFTHGGKGYWVIKDEIKKMVLYRRLNLMREQFPFKKKFHVIFCRNVMIYFDRPTREKLVNKLYNNTEEGGYLFVSHSESLDRKTCPYKYIQPGIYRRLDS